MNTDQIKNAIKALSEASGESIEDITNKANNGDKQTMRMILLSIDLNGF